MVLFPHRRHIYYQMTLLTMSILVMYVTRLHPFVLRIYLLLDGQYFQDNSYSNSYDKSVLIPPLSLYPYKTAVRSLEGWSI